MDGNGKKKISDLEKKNLSSSKTGESVGNAKQTNFYFWPKCQKKFSHSSEANIHCLLSQKVITDKLSVSYLTLNEWDIIIHSMTNQ